MKHDVKKVSSTCFEETFDKIDKIPPTYSLSIFWGKLNRFWDFFNYELFQHVVRVMFTEADDPLLSKLAEYESDMDGFLSSTKLCDFFKVWPFSIKNPQVKEVSELKNVVVKVNKSWDDCTLRDIKNISSTFAQGFFLPREFLLVAGVGKSSVSILWSVPLSLASSIEEQVKQGKEDFLADNGFLSISIVVLLPPMKKCFLKLKKLYDSTQVKNLHDFHTETIKEVMKRPTLLGYGAGSSGYRSSYRTDSSGYGTGYGAGSSGYETGSSGYGTGSSGNGSGLSGYRAGSSGSSLGPPSSLSERSDTLVPPGTVLDDLEPIKLRFRLESKTPNIPHSMFSERRQHSDTLVPPDHTVLDDPERVKLWSRLESKTPNIPHSERRQHSDTLVPPDTVLDDLGEFDTASSYTDKLGILNTLGFLSNGFPARLVLVEGVAGVGKSTLGEYACRKWTTKEFLTDSVLLFLLPLRDFNLQNIKHLHELLALIHPGDKSLVEELEANKGEGTAFWLDGWDEIASTLDGRSSFFEKLVSGEILPKARVIVTSRPWATDYIKKILDNQPSQHIEIVASVQDQIDWLIELQKRSPPTSSSFLEKFLKYLDETPAVKGHMHTPLATNITLLVYQWCQESSSALPTTVTQLYTAYTCFCIHRYLDNHPNFGPNLWKSNNFSDLSEPLKTFFHSLSGISLHGLHDKLPRLVFPDLPDHLRLETLGLMQTVDPLYTSDKSAVVSYNFNHPTLQEYLAAFSLSQMSDEERSAIIQKCVNDVHFNEVLRFLNGLTKSSPILRDHMRRMIDDPWNNLTFFHWLFEGGDKASIADTLGEGKVSVHSYLYSPSWSALDYVVTGYCIARSNCAWDIDFHSVHMGDEKMTQFLQALCTVDGEQGIPSITSINFDSNDLTSESLRYMQDIPAPFLRHLKRLNVSSNKLDGTAVDHIAKTIPHMPQLEVLNLSGNCTKKGGASLVLALCDHKALKELNLSGTNIAEEDCEQLAHLLCSSQCLESLNVSNNSLSSDSVHILFGSKQNSSLKRLFMSRQSISLEAMMTLSAYLGDNDKCKLETLELKRCDISTETAIELAHGLSRNCSVKKLNLYRNPLGDSGVTALGSVLETNQTITTLTLMHCSMTTIGGGALASSLMTNSTIKELNISCNSLGGEAIQKFAELIQHNKTLKKLVIQGDNSLTQSDIDTLLNSLTNNQTLKQLILPRRRVKDTDNFKGVEWW